MTCVYRVRTISGGQISHGTESSPIKLFAVNVPDTTTVTASLIGKTVLVSWVAVPDAFSYWVDRRCGTQAYQQISTQPLSAATTSYTDSNPVTGTSCTYLVRVTRGNFTSRGRESNPVEIPAMP